MTQELQLRVLPVVASSTAHIADYIAREKGLDRRTITHIHILRRSIDARQRVIYVNLLVRVYINEAPPDEDFTPVQYHDVSRCARVIIVGAGPAGLFAALQAIELGVRPIVLERGKDVHERKKDTARLTKSLVDPESNYAFGEGGAGAFSDGKLYTRSKKRGSVEKILRVLCQHGAPLSILCDAHPHIGTDHLPRVIENIRSTIISAGGEVHFNTKMLRLLITSNGQCEGCEALNMVSGNEEHYYGPVILATGHSARDIYHYLHARSLALQSKALAMGVRLEHPSALIDRIQYHNKHGRGDYLPAAEYAFVTQVAGRGVYSFCMCPGGYVIPATTSATAVVVNGMSAASRASAWSNAGMVVELHPADIGAADDAPLAMMAYQEQLEQTAYLQTHSQRAPAQRMSDFVEGRLSYDLPRSSYAPQLVSCPLHALLPSFIGDRLRHAFRTFGATSHGFLTNDAVVIAAETRTSAPVRILRDDATLQHVSLPGLFPCGEGAGYAGGIVSSAIDGERCATAAARLLSAKE